LPVHTWRRHRHEQYTAWSALRNDSELHCPHTSTPTGVAVPGMQHCFPVFSASVPPATWQPPFLRQRKLFSVRSPFGPLSQKKETLPIITGVVHTQSCSFGSQVRPIGQPRSVHPS